MALNRRFVLVEALKTAAFRGAIYGAAFPDYHVREAKGELKRFRIVGRDDSDCRGCHFLYGLCVSAMNANQLKAEIKDPDGDPIDWKSWRLEWV